MAKYLDTPAPPPEPSRPGQQAGHLQAGHRRTLAAGSQSAGTSSDSTATNARLDGGITILKDYVQAVRKDATRHRAYVRMEPAPGERFDIDWGHFGALNYSGTPRKLYAFCLVECHSRKMYLEFTHSQSFETFVRCHMHAFQTLGGCARELWFDNLATAVAEHEGNLVRFNPRFLAFAREYSFIPRACHVAAAWEKGKIERAIGYVRQNFWPLRSFADLSDVNSQARQWLERSRQPAHTSRNRTDSRRAFSARDAAGPATAHARLSRYRRGPRPQRSPPDFRRQPLLRAAALCRADKLTVKADSSSVTIYDQITRS